jgi:hypothetical protein
MWQPFEPVGLYLTVFSDWKCREWYFPQKHIIKLNTFYAKIIRLKQ